MKCKETPDAKDAVDPALILENLDCADYVLEN